MTIENSVRRILPLLVFCAALVLPAAAQPRRTAEIRRIDAYVKTVKAAAGRKRPELIFADTAGESNGRPKWRRFASVEALENFREKVSETYTIAYCRRRQGRLVEANFTRFSESGDWAQYDFYYFRGDGTLARVESELRTFYGDLIVLVDIYYDPRGRRLRRTVRFRDLRTKKPIAKPAETDFRITDIPVYKTVRRLPFASKL